MMSCGLVGRLIASLVGLTVLVVVLAGGLRSLELQKEKDGYARDEALRLKFEENLAFKVGAPF
jgi:hypothetical protein